MIDKKLIKTKTKMNIKTKITLDMIMFINGYHRNQPTDRRMHP